MILGASYAGDDEELMKLQFGHYWDALPVLIDTISKSYRNACAISGTVVPECGWPAEGGVDHRTIQGAHDVLAARWRHVVSPPEPSYSFGSVTSPARPELTDWLNWLRAEIRSWAVDSPELISLCVRIFQNQNTDAGYEAERQLQALLRGRYSEIVWLHERASRPL